MRAALQSNISFPMESSGVEAHSLVWAVKKSSSGRYGATVALVLAIDTVMLENSSPLFFSCSQLARDSARFAFVVEVLEWGMREVSFFILGVSDA